MEAPSILTLEDKIAGLEEPNLNAFVIQGLDEIWVGTKKTFILTCMKTANGGIVKSKLGGLWSANISPADMDYPLIPIEVMRFGNDSAELSHIFPSSGDFKLRITVTGISVKGSPFHVRVNSGSSNQIGKWPRIEEFIISGGDHSNFPAEPPELDMFRDLKAMRHRDCLEYRRHLLVDPRFKEEISKPVIIETTGNIADIEVEAIFISLNSWMEWPKENGYQARILKRIPEKEREKLADKCSSFASSKLLYGSTMIFPILNISPLGESPRSVLLVNTVTVLLKTKRNITISESKKNPYKTTKYEDLKGAIFLGLSEANKKGITSIALPHQISKNFYSGIKNEEAVLTIIREWTEQNPKAGLNTIFVVEKLPSPRPERKKRLSLHLKK